MIEERFRLMVLSKDGTGIRQISLTWKKFCLLATLFCVLLLGVTVLSVGIFTRLYHNYRISTLKNDRDYLHRELLTIKEKVALLSNELADVETSGDQLRNVTNLPPIDSDTRQVGVGGPTLYASIDMGIIGDETNRSASEIKMDLEKLERAVRLEKSSLMEITSRLKEQEDWVNHFPSIRPVLGGRINSPFGMRTDPFTNKLTAHNGVDMFMPKGTHILASADGVVKKVVNKYTPNKSWGRYVLVDHGYGYETLYGHCSKIDVRPGQKVKRWQKIAEVGMTGRAEGYHLHYEVRKDGVRVNPEYYLFN